MVKIIIAGSREFNDYELLKKETVKWMVEDLKLLEEVNIKGNKPTIISGGARGADELGEKFAARVGFQVEKHPANWDLYGKSAGYKRNEEMAKIADACICFWDGKSRGTKHMIDLAQKHNLKLKIILT